MSNRKFDDHIIDQSQVIKQSKFLHDNPTPERGTVKFDFITSLQNIVMAKIVYNMWMNKNTQQEIMKLICSHNMWMNKNTLQEIMKLICCHIGRILKESSDEWHEIENNIIAKISQFSLPPFISSKLTYIVPAIGHSILQWIRHHDKLLQYTDDYCSVNLISNIACTARGKIDYAQTARNILANRDICLSEDDKFKLACSYCLEDEIALFSTNVVAKYNSDNIDIEMHPMIYFWIIHITGISTEMSNNKFFKVLTKRTCNEVAIVYVWNKLSAEEKAKNIAPIIQKLQNHNLTCTLLTNLEYEQQQDIFKECSSSILCGLLQDWSWEEYFLPTALHFLDVMKTNDFIKVFIELFGKIKQCQVNKFVYDQYKSIFKELWKKCSRSVKDFVFEYENAFYLTYFLLVLSCKQNMDIIGLILNDLSIQQRKNALFGNRGIDCCIHLILRDMWDPLELFFMPSLFSDNDTIKFKQSLVTEGGHDIAERFLKQNALDKIEHFMTWAFNSQKEIDQFRRSLSHSVICDAALESIIAHNKADFTELEIHFNWCAKCDLNAINEFKAKVPKFFKDRFISHLIGNDHCDLLEKVLNWCFLDDQKKIVQFKSDMYKDDNLALCIKSITIDLIKKDHSFTMLERFLGWCFTDEQESAEFKTWLLNPLGDPYSVSAKLLSQHDLELADKFINWCITSSEEICIYKNTLMLSNRDMKFILYCFYEKKDFQSLIKWFNPSKDTLQKFHIQFLEGDVLHYEPKLYELLRETIESLINLEDNEENAI